MKWSKENQRNRAKERSRPSEVAGFVFPFPSPRLHLDFLPALPHTLLAILFTTTRFPSPKRKPLEKAQKTEANRGTTIRDPGKLLPFLIFRCVIIHAWMNFPE